MAFGPSAAFTEPGSELSMKQGRRALLPSNDHYLVKMFVQSSHNGVRRVCVDDIGLAVYALRDVSTSCTAAAEASAATASAQPSEPARTLDDRSPKLIGRPKTEVHRPRLAICRNSHVAVHRFHHASIAETGIGSCLVDPSARPRRVWPAHPTNVRKALTIRELTVKVARHEAPHSAQAQFTRNC